MTAPEDDGSGGDAGGPPRFLTDEDFNGDVVAGLRRAQPAIDLLTASQAGTRQWADPDVLAWAMRHNRILLSHDQRTMPAHFSTFLAEIAPDGWSPGVLLVPQKLAIGRSIDAVLEVWACCRHEEWRDLLVRLPL